jgi:alkanesulfonate monooxygenase SsuD/methylene tetrahydromethanopterin reductase-like flavin-dependent oxidoreductase (luciferase family)
VNAVVADTVEEAGVLALPQLQHMARLRSGQRLAAQSTVEEAAATELPQPMVEMIERMRGRWVIDAPDAAASRIRDLAAQFGVDEVMVSPGAAAHDAAVPATVPGRVRTLELLAAEILG